MDVKCYDTKDHFDLDNPNNGIIPPTYTVSKNDLYRYAIRYGSPSVSMNDEVVRYRKSIIDSFLKVSNGDVHVKNLEFLESSEKVGLSYYIGMIFAQMIAEKAFNIKQLFHIQPTDFDREMNNYQVITTNYPDRTKIPDLVGVSNLGNNLMMFEAKGSTSDDKPTKQVKKGVEQLESVRRIILLKNQLNITELFNKSLNRYPNAFVVATRLEKNTDKLLSWVVDPDVEGDLEIRLNSDYYSFKQYSSIVSLLLDAEGRNGDYIYYRIDELDMTVGVLRSIYELFNGRNGRIEGTFESIQQTLDNRNFERDLQTLQEELQMENISLGLDGIFIGGN